jgi:hypothetical protein
MSADAYTQRLQPARLDSARAVVFVVDHMDADLHAAPLYVLQPTKVV